MRGLLKTIAWRRARDRARKERPDSVDPASPVVAMALIPEELPDLEAQLRLDGAVIRQIVGRLEPRQAAVLKLRFDCAGPASVGAATSLLRRVRRTRFRRGREPPS